MSIFDSGRNSVQGFGQMGRVQSSSDSVGCRVSEACARCRRQKLKCDTAKPCTNCIRSGMECQPRALSSRKPRKRKASNTSDPELLGCTTAQRGSTVVAQSLRATAASESATSVLDPSTPATDSSSRPTETQQFGANRSAISLAVNMYESLGTHAPEETRPIPGDAAPNPSSRSMWELQSMQMLPPPVMEVLFDVYFDKMHWFIFILHKPYFLTQARQVLTATSWQRKEMPKVLATLMVAAIGLKCAIQNTTAEGQRLLSTVSSDPEGTISQIITEVRIHLLDLLDENCIETVQVIMLLGTFYIFHGSQNLAWAMIGLSVRASYALALHCASDTEDQIQAQIRRRCWNHLTVADTFASQIYGRPASLDQAFSDLLPLSEMDDTALDLSGESQVLDQIRNSVTALTFHVLKFKLYEVIRKALSTFRVLRFHNPMTAEELQSLINAVHHVDVLLARWEKSLPAVFSCELSQEGNQPSVKEQLERYDGDNSDLKSLKLQARMLQLTYDAATILVHRPLLEHKLSPEYREGVSKNIMESVSKSFDISVKAALRISRTPVMQFRDEFCMAFVFVHLFTAGVILCIPPTSHPMSSTSQEAKAGVVRIIQASRLLKCHSQIASHTERLLTDLFKLSTQREIEIALKDEPEPAQQAVDTAQLLSEQAHPQVVSRNGPSIPGEHAGAASHLLENQIHDRLLQDMPNDNSDADTPSYLHDPNTTDFGDRWVEPYLIFQGSEHDDGSSIQQLNLELDSTFNAFGQVMFNLMPDDPYSTWNWGKGSL